MDEPLVTLSSLASGAAEELFAQEFAKVLKNIDDPNTDTKTVREINLKVRFTPNEDRTMGDTTITCVAKLAPTKKVKTVVYIGRRNGKLVGVESNPKQMSFDTAPARPTPIEEGRKDK